MSGPIRATGGIPACESRRGDRGEVGGADDVVGLAPGGRSRRHGVAAGGGLGGGWALLLGLGFGRGSAGERRRSRACSGLTMGDRQGGPGGDGPVVDTAAPQHWRHAVHAVATVMVVFRKPPGSIFLNCRKVQQHV